MIQKTKYVARLIFNLYLQYIHVEVPQEWPADCIASCLLQLPLSVLYQASEPQQQRQSRVVHPRTR